MTKKYMKVGVEVVEMESFIMRTTAVDFLQIDLS